MQKHSLVCPLFDLAIDIRKICSHRKLINDLLKDGVIVFKVV